MNLASNLIEWYKQNYRELPWRETDNPYKIWLSEIILQQTRVQQGLPYYEKFTTQYPTVIDLANADEDEVLKLWQGLGYYSRAKNLRATAIIIRDHYKGVFPKDYNNIRNLKGIGDYTAAAISSFAFNTPKAVVDGNVLRVLSRVFNVSTPIDTSQGKKEFQAIADAILPQDHYHFNQAIMELGARICTPKSPLCFECPIADFCEGKLNWPTLPVKSKKITKKVEHLNFVVITDQHHIILHKRDHSNIWKGLYQFPMISGNKKLSSEEIRVQLNLKESLDLKLAESFKHQLTHKDLRCHFNLLTIEQWDDEMLNLGQQYSLSEIEKLAVPKPVEIFLNNLPKLMNLG